MALKLGTTDVSSLRLGTTVIDRLMLGTTQVWPASGVTATPTATYKGQGQRTSGTSAYSAGPFTYAAGSRILAFQHIDGQSTSAKPTINNGQVFTTLREQANPGVMAHEAPCPSAGSYTVSIPGDGFKAVTHVWEIAGFDTADPHGVIFGAENVGTNDLTASFTAETAGLIVIGAAEWNALGTVTSSNLTDTHTYDQTTVWVNWISGKRKLTAAGAASINLNAGGTGTAWWAYTGIEYRSA